MVEWRPIGDDRVVRRLRLVSSNTVIWSPLRGILSLSPFTDAALVHWDIQADRWYPVRSILVTLGGINARSFILMSLMRGHSLSVGRSDCNGDCPTFEKVIKYTRNVCRNVDYHISHNAMHAAFKKGGKLRIDAPDRPGVHIQRRYSSSRIGTGDWRNDCSYSKC